MRNEPTTSFPGELPSVLTSAFDLANENGLSLRGVADELAWYPNRVRTLLSQHDKRPILRIVLGSPSSRFWRAWHGEVQSVQDLLRAPTVVRRPAANVSLITGSWHGSDQRRLQSARGRRRFEIAAMEKGFVPVGSRKTPSHRVC